MAGDLPIRLFALLKFPYWSRSKSFKTTMTQFCLLLFIISFGKEIAFVDLILCAFVLTSFFFCFSCNAVALVPMLLSVVRGSLGTPINALIQALQTKRYVSFHSIG